MRFKVVNIGCKVNRVEVDAASAQLIEQGACMTRDADADIVIVNTCTVTAEADKKTRKAVRAALRSNPAAQLVVTGCAAVMNPAWFEELDERVHVVAKPEVVSQSWELVETATGAPGRGGLKELYSSGGACKQAPILAENAPLAHFPGARIMLKQSSLGEMPTGHFSRCGTARGTPRPSPSCPEQVEESDATDTHLGGVSEQDVKVAEAALEALELGEEEGDLVVASSGSSSDAFSEAVLTAPLPKAVEEAAARVRKGEVRVNEVSGPAIPAAPRTKRIAPADPQPAEGEVSLSFEVHRDSAATRAIKAEKERKAKAKGGFFRRLRGKSGNDA